MAATEDYGRVARHRGDPLEIYVSVISVLALGTSVVLDWNHWSRQRRVEARERARASGFELVVHYLDVPVDLAVKRATARRESNPSDAHIITEEGVRHMSTILEPPSASEGFIVVRHLP